MYYSTQIDEMPMNGMLLLPVFTVYSDHGQLRTSLLKLPSRVQESSILRKGELMCLLIEMQIAGVLARQVEERGPVL